MAKQAKQALVARVVKELSNQGWTVEALTDAGAVPTLLSLKRGRKLLRLRVYIWNLTHGGGSMRPKHEFRIQVTGGVTKFQREKGEQTLILGWSDDFGAFAGFDYRFHSKEVGASPSMQINSAALLRAAEAGIATRTKTTGEIAVAVRPDLLARYIEDLQALHGKTTSQKMVDIVQTDVLSDRKTTTPVDVAGVTSQIEKYSQSKSRRRSADANELAQRKTVIERLEALERKIEKLGYSKAKIGHNHPPEPIDAEAAVSSLDGIKSSAKALRQELSKDKPDIPEVSKHAGILGHATTLLGSIGKEGRKFGEKLRDKVRDKAVEGAVAGIITLGSIYQSDVQGALAAAVRSIGLWIGMVI